MKHSSRDVSTSPESSPAVNIVTTVPQVAYVVSPSSSKYSHRQSIHSKVSDHHISNHDEKSERISTVLVWKDLTVSAKAKKNKLGFLHLNSKDSKPTNKRLLHKLSGAIAGGIWAVMGKNLLNK